MIKKLFLIFLLLPLTSLGQSCTIYFPKGKCEANSSEWKKQEVINLLKMIERDSLKIDHIMLSSSGSVEGENHTGSNLSINRVSYTMHHLEKKFAFLKGNIRAYSISEDWETFFELASKSTDSTAIRTIQRTYSSFDIREEKVAELLIKHSRIEKILAPLRKCEITIHYKPQNPISTK